MPAWNHTTLGLLRGLNSDRRGKTRSNAKEDAKGSAMHLTEKAGFWKLGGVYLDDVDVSQERRGLFR